MNNPYSPDSALHDIITTLLSRPVAPLVPDSPWKSEMAAVINRVAAAEQVPVFVTATLHLLNDDLDRVHRLVQAQEGDQTADYLHMLVHRREGDWSNTGYWVRRTGAHPLYATLSETIRGETNDSVIEGIISGWGPWNPSAMLELCRQAGSGKPDTITADAVALLSTLETASALDWCVKSAA